MGKQVPIVGYLALDDGPPHLVAWEAVGSVALYFDRRIADANPRVFPLDWSAGEMVRMPTAADAARVQRTRSF